MFHDMIVRKINSTGGGDAVPQPRVTERPFGSSDKAAGGRWSVLLEIMTFHTYMNA